MSIQRYRPVTNRDPAIRAGIPRSPGPERKCYARAETLVDGLRTGLWHDNHADLIQHDSLDVGYRIIIAEPEGGITRP